LSTQHSIDFLRLLKAADDLEEIYDAGGEDQLANEFWARVREDPAANAAACTRWTDPAVEWAVNRRASLLSLLTSAPVSVCRDAVRESLGRLPQREIGLKLLAEWANAQRRRKAEERRDRRHTWRS
jgi:hypothetical protein